MKILIVSDTHHDDEILMKIYHKHPNMDIYLHAGDSCLYKYQLDPFISCKGNCDHYSDFEQEILLPTPYGPLLMRHLPDFNVTKFKTRGIKIYVFGHTHNKYFTCKDGIYFINPGSLVFPRDSNTGSYAILNISKEEVKCNFFTL